LRFYGFVTCSVAPSHCPPETQDTHRNGSDYHTGRGTDVRFGSKADIPQCDCHVRFATNSRQSEPRPRRPLSAKCGHRHFYRFMNASQYEFAATVPVGRGGTNRRRKR
jgi:hypothetical protein